MILTAHELSKSFHSRKKGKRVTVDAVRSIELAVEEGEIFGFLGPNGAGKSTTVRMLGTLLSVDNGEVFIAGYDLRRQPFEVRRRIGYVSQAGGADRAATARENLLLQARLHGLPDAEARRRTDAVIVDLEMGSFADRMTGTYSGGQRRKLDLALGMVHRPGLLFLDEPTTGLDPVSRANLWEQIRLLRKSGTTVFLTTHYLDEADSLCDRVAIIDNGTLVAEGSPTQLKRRISGDVVTLSVNHAPDAAERAALLLESEPFVRNVGRIDEKIRLTVDNGEEALPSILRRLDAAGLAVVSISLARPTLDDVFLTVTGHSLDDPSITLSDSPAAQAVAASH
ncbi:MAG TPA: ATP-binding cassette domain-containing protein [Spirochaetia bacterium]|nr:ATP-binding cassette domain-containing protein [Spirochaetia bacterium]